MPKQTFFDKTWLKDPACKDWLKRLVAQIPLSNAKFTRKRTKRGCWVIWKLVPSKSTWQLMVTKTR